MKVGVTGATGFVGRRLVAALLERGHEVRVFSRNASRARELVADVVEWDPASAPAPPEALADLDGVVNLVGEPIDQRWNEDIKRRIGESRIAGTSNLVAGLERAEPRPSVLVSASAAGYYGDRGEEILEEDASPATDFLADLCVQWEAAADEASSLGLRVVKVRTGIALDGSGGALQRMLLPFRLGVGGPLGSGRQYMPWIALDDLVEIYVAALEGGEWSGPVNACGPQPARNREFARALGRVLHRPAVMPVPPFALRIVLGELAGSVTSSQRMVPSRALAAGYRFQYPELEAALRAAVGRE